MDRIFEILIQQYEYDVNAMSQPWMYWVLFIPILLYMTFFICKWVVLTAPVWIPIVLVVQAFRKKY
jgi:hypothetical protein